MFTFFYSSSRQINDTSLVLQNRKNGAPSLVRRQRCCSNRVGIIRTTKHTYVEQPPPYNSSLNH